jgi:hypothetical protein
MQVQAFAQGEDMMEAQSQKVIFESNLGLDQQGMLYTALEKLMEETRECVFVESIYADADGELYATVQGSKGSNCGTVLILKSEGWVPIQ